MTLEIIEKNRLLFLERNNVYVIVSGSILMKNHEKLTDTPETFAKFGCGDILNFK